MLKTNVFYSKRAGSSLILLWIGAIVLLIAMLYNWRIDKEKGRIAGSYKPDDVFVDQLLFSSHDLQLGDNVGLINISLNRNTARLVKATADSTVNTPPERKLVYSKMLNDKIRKISSTPASRNNGFTIKPLPQ